MQHSSVVSAILSRMTIFTILTYTANSLPCINGEAPVAINQGMDTATVPCPAGTYNPGCNYGCVLAQPGFFASGTTSTAQTACPADQYSGSGASACFTLPTGYVAQQASTIPYLCPEGFYASGTGYSARCIICPAGSYCTFGSTSPTAVTAGYYSNEGQSYQIFIPPGASGNPPSLCALGYYTSGSSCLICPAGSACPDPSLDKVQCPAGFYNAQTGQTTCTGCPAGSFCAAGSTTATDCAAGTFSLGYTSSCQACPAGYKCSDPSSVPTICGAGQTAPANSIQCFVNIATMSASNIVAPTAISCSAGSYYVYNASEPVTRCLICPLGHYCPSTTSYPIPCASGYYASLEGATSCTQCPAGSACFYPHQDPILCPTTLGYTSLAGMTGCYLNSVAACTDGSGNYAYPNIGGTAYACPEGYACPYCFQPPILCPYGYYSNAGAATCTLCEAGFYCPGSMGSLRAACASGTNDWYSAAGSVNCYPVPSHMTTPNTATRPNDFCKYGQYSALTINTCVDCPLNSQCLSDDLAPIACNNLVDKTTEIAYTSSILEISCFPKLSSRGGPDYIGAAALYPSSKFDIHVTPGLYAQPGGSHQFDCPMGRECLFPMENIFVQCPPGYFSRDNSFSCQPCPEGVVCPIMQEQYIDYDSKGWTQTGYFSPYGTHVELRIPAGWWTDSTNNRMIRPCALGYYSLDGATGGCTICPVGYACPFASNVPIRCNEGHQALFTGMHECTPCNDGQWFQPSSQTCITIPTNTYVFHPIFTNQACDYNMRSDSSTFGNEEYVDCYPTISQYYLKSTNSYLTCPVGFYCLHSGTAQTYTKFPCPAGTYNSGLTGKNLLQDECIVCSAGNFCTGGTQGQQTCPAGYVCPLGTKFATQFPCPKSTMNPLTGQSTYSACVSCTSGKLCLEGTGVTAFDCPPGQNCASSQWTAGACASGTISASGSCSPCPAGQYCRTAASYGTKCPSGTYNPNTGGKSPSDCLLADVGQSVPRYGMISLPNDYPAHLGYVYPKGTAFSHQLPCPAGQICNSGTLARSWTNCTANFACPRGSSTTSAVNCERGYLCPSGTLDSRQFPQASGFYTYQVGQTAIQCPAGYYCPAGTTRQRPCPLGYYCAAGTEDFRDYPCPNGKYGQTIQLTAATDCLACPAGFYCQMGIAKPIPCPSGTYSAGGADSSFTTSGLGFSTPCTVCTAGSQCPNQAMTAPIQCGLGFFSPPGSMMCFRCYAGHLCDSATTSQAYMEANKCTGVKCVTYSVYELSTCPSGYYCDPNQFKPLACPVGTYQDSTVSQASSATCVNVPAGWYNDKEGQNFTQIATKLCAPGYTCVAGSISQFNSPCARGTYNPSTGQTACIDCPAGYFCLGATIYPIPCPAGYYCPINSWQPVPCITGTFGANIKLTSQSQCTTCTRGSYCAEPGIQAPTGLCNAGYYCNAGSIIPQQFDCPTGGFCEKGSWQKQNCPAGFYNEDLNAKTFWECALCTPGQYCDGSTSSSTTGQCVAGWYCLSGSRVIDQHAATPGHFTLTGAPQQTVCPAKTYQPYYHQSDCLPCPAGFYCDKTGMAEPKICPVGKYCEISSESPVQCPVGTYNPVTGGTSIANHCLPCPPGRYCAQKGLSAPSGDCNAGYFCLISAETNKPSALDLISGRWGKCTPGHYCPIGTAYPYPCPAGRFSASEQLTQATDCTLCTAGSYCETTGLTVVTGPCDAGYFCPAGQTRPRLDTYKCTEGNYCLQGSTAMKQCPGGTYQYQQYQSACLICPGGYFCVAGSINPTICPAGSYCSEQASSPILCPIGKFMPDSGAISDCLPCIAGSYCLTTGLTATTGICNAGYYCTSSAISATPTSGSQGGSGCSKGEYCPPGSGFPLKCPPGKACTLNTMTDTDMLNVIYDCDAGYYCTLGSSTKTPLSGDGGDICPVGNYCPAASVAPIPCPPGTYRNSNKGKLIADCLPCDIGSYSPDYGSTTCLICDDGWYCEQRTLADGTIRGETSPTPWDTVNNIPKLCPVGFFCVQGKQSACVAKYSDQIGSTSCLFCPAGFQCTTSALSNCGNFNYCPSGDMLPTGCSLGYYNLKSNAVIGTECILCPAGYFCTCTWDATNTYCISDAIISPCPETYYCPQGSFTNVVTVGSPTKLCDAGYICPAGTSQMIPCPAGYMCDGTGNTDSTKVDCPAGYYCPGGVGVGIGGTKSKIYCEAGYYCPINSKFHYPCELGTYNEFEGKTAITDCLVCMTGICSNRAQTIPDQALWGCESGYYCPPGSGKFECPKGYYCPENQEYPIGCPIGQYTDNTAQAVCQKCPAGFYCGDDILDVFLSQTTANILADSAIPCVPGQYCPKGSSIKSLTSLPGIGCPAGTYNPDFGARNVGDCIYCPESFKCLTTGNAGPLSALTSCDAGYYCPAASISKGKISCPTGAYCPAGSAYFTTCSIGTYQDNKLKTASTDCLPCSVNYYCPTRGMQSSSMQLCGEGFVCLGGTTISSPIPGALGNFCPIGKYCSSQIAGPQDCGLQTYQPNLAQSSCIYCPEGKLCDITALPEPNQCPIGSYCPGKTNSVANIQILCPAGTYSGIVGIGTEEQCVPCPPGKYCPAGTIDPTLDTFDCDENFFCPLGSSSPNGYSIDYVFGSNSSGLCPAGYMCVKGTKAPEPCPRGTYNELSGQSTCLPCKPGKFCDQLGMSELTPNNDCYAGYYCNGGSDIPNPTLDPFGKGDFCQPGYYCPKGSSAPQPCLPGSYERRTGSDSCQICPEGYYCKAVSFSPIQCQNGYCPEASSEPLPCPPGTYGNEALKKMKSVDDCPFCPNGYWCDYGEIGGTCDAGYFCDFGAISWQDDSKICPQGHYCPAGTLLPIRCPETLYYSGKGARDVSFCKPCQAGYYCLDNDSVSRVCPVGHFCPLKTKEPVPCWIGTYQPYKRQTSSNKCLLCPAGANCNARGIDDYARHMCPVGHYCPTAGSTKDPIPCPVGTYRNATGAISIDECWICPEGHFCSLGATFALPCDSGYYCPSGSEVQQACPPGTYCPALSANYTICPAGYFCSSYRTDIYTKCGNGTYCASGQSQATQCPPGQFGTSETFNFGQNVSCIPCGPGQYSDAKSKTCKPCDPGYICFAGATTARPNSPSQNGKICDPGYYCLGGSITGVACPVGTQSPDKGNGQLNQCKPCPINTFGNDVGLTNCTPCSGSTVSDIGSTTCRCVGLNRKYLADVKSCVCLSGFTPVDGTSPLNDGLSDCQRIIYERCDLTQERDSLGKCRNKTDCSAECNGGQGTIQSNFGICQCNDIVTTAQICNAQCQNNALQTSFTSDGLIRIYDPLTKNTTTTPLPNTIGQAKCSKEDQTKCELLSVGMIATSTGAFIADYNLPSALTKNATISSIQNATQSRYKTNSFKGVKTFGLSFNTSSMNWNNQRDLQDTNQDASYIQNPVVCTTRGSALLFNNLNSQSFPVYQKDNLLNTNQNFDYGQFSSLSTQLAGKTSVNFIFTFDEPGVYVFSDSRNTNKLMIISVMADNNVCPVDSKFSPMTYAALLKVGAYRNEVLTPPDWNFFFLTLISFVVLIIAFVFLISYIARRDWKQTKIPQILYQNKHYEQVERDDPSDKRSIVSINTDSSSFMFRAQGQDDGQDMGDQLVERMKGNQIGGKTKPLTEKRQRSRKDLSLNQVENLKDALHKHLKEIKKLRALRFGKDGAEVEDELDGVVASDVSSSDEDELNNAIFNVKKLIANARAVLRGEGEDEIQIFTEDTKLIEAINTNEDKKAEREKAIQERKIQIEESQKVSEDKFRRKIQQESDIVIRDLEDMKNKVLEMQVESAYDKGKAFQERMSRGGAKELEVQDMMHQLEGKMQRVEDLLLDDKERQNEMLKRQLEQRRARRRKLNEKLVEIDEHLYKNEFDQADSKNEVVKELQEELKQQMTELDQQDVLARQAVNMKFEKIKQDKLADYQDKLRNAGGTKDFQNILDKYQSAQVQVDKELARQIQKENAKLDNDLKARRAKLKAQAEIRRNQRFKDLEIEQANSLNNKMESKAKIEESLSVNDRKDEIMNVFSNRLKEHVNSENQLVSAMENHRREEEAFRQEHERKQRKLQADTMKESTVLNQEVNEEINRLKNIDSFEPFQNLVVERANIQKSLNTAATEQEKALLLQQLKEVDDQVKNQLGKEAKDQDAALRRKLEARRLKREVAIEKERELKQANLQERIVFALDNSTAFAVHRNDLTNEGFDKIFNQMKMELTPEEIPAALENLLDDKHQKELSDWLLKLYEQKAIELKEEILALLEEKIAKQQVVKQNYEDRASGIDSIISRTDQPATVNELKAKKDLLKKEMQDQVNKLEQTFIQAETRKTREIQARCMDRESKALEEMSEMHFEEKKNIFQKFLPQSMMRDIYEELSKKEREQMDLYKRELEQIKQAKLKQMEEEEIVLQAELANHQSQLNKLSYDDQILAKQQQQLQRRQRQAEREKELVLSSKDVISKIRNDMERGLQGLSGAYEEEHKRQIALMEARLASRSKQVTETLEQKKVEQLHKAEQAELEKLKEHEKVRECRKRRTALLETITQNQKMIFKGAYSRPLWPFNKKLHEALNQNDLAGLLNNQSIELKEQVMGRLLAKVSELEEKVNSDVNKPKEKGGLMARLAGKAKFVDTESAMSKASSDKQSTNARQIMSNLFKKKF